MQLLKAAREKSIRIVADKKYDEKNKEMLSAVILHLVCEGVLRVIELTEGENLRSLYIVGLEEVENLLLKQLEKNCDDHIFINKVLYGKKADENNGIKAISQLFEKIGWQECFQNYCKRWMPEIIGGNSYDEENRREAGRIFERLLPITNEKGQLLLAEDQQGNQILAYVKRHNESGDYTFGIFRKGADGKVGKSVTIGADEVVSASTKVRKKIQNAEGTFSAQHATEGIQRLWLWNLSRKFQYVEEADDYAMNDINSFLKDWIKDNVGTVFRESLEDEGTEPVFAGEIKGKYIAGIWSDSMQPVFDVLELKMKAKVWIPEAAKEGWIKRYAVSCGDNKETLRRAYNPSMAQRKEFMRENKSERIYIFDFSNEEAKEIYAKREAQKLARKLPDKERGGKTV